MRIAGHTETDKEHHMENTETKTNHIFCVKVSRNFTNVDIVIVSFKSSFRKACQPLNGKSEWYIILYPKINALAKKCMNKVVELNGDAMGLLERKNFRGKNKWSKRNNERITIPFSHSRGEWPSVHSSAETGRYIYIYRM